MSDTICTHHNDQQREACPVCLVTQLRLDCDNETKWAAHYLAQSIAEKARADKAEAELAAERAIVSRIWVQLGSPSYDQLKGRSIYDLVDQMNAELADAQQEGAHYMSVAQKATDELTRIRAENLAAHKMACAAGLERDQLRAERAKTALSDPQQLEDTITFHCGQAHQEIMRLDKDSMTYKGQRIEDGGEAHRAFLAVMSTMREAAK